MQNNTEISLAEELVLLLLNQKTGYLEVTPGWAFSCVMGGAVIADLALRGRIDTDLETLYLTDARPTADGILDVTLQEIAKSEKIHDAQYWIERNASRVEDIVNTSFDRLVDRGILVRDLGDFFGLSRSVSRSGVYPSNGSTVRREAKARILDVILNHTIPDPRDAILVALVDVSQGFKFLLEEEDYEEGLERIKLVAKFDLVGRTVAVAVENSTVQPRRSATKTRPIPKVKISDVLRQKAFLKGNIAKGLRGLEAQYGSVMKLPFKMQGVPLYAMMGADANQWVHKYSRFYFRSKEYIKDFEGVFASTTTLPGTDGAEHYRMRRFLKGVYTRSALEERLSDMYRFARSSMQGWKVGDVLPVTSTLRDMASIQVMNLYAGVDCRHFSRELLDYEHRALITQVAGSLPKFMLKTPKMRRYRKYVDELREMILESHTPGQRKGLPVDIPDKFLELHRNDPQFLSETDLTFSLVAIMVASIYMGGALGFVLYCLLSNQEIHDAVYQEAKKLFGNGHTPKGEDFCPRNTDVTVRLIQETTRMYPIIPWQIRGVVNSCTFGRYEIPAGSRVLICSTAPHYNAYLYKNPDQFDIDRYLPDRAEHKQPGAWAPYGLGTHTCPGQRQTDLQLAVNVLLMVYHFRMELLPKDSELKINPFPSSAPRKKIKFRIAEIRNPIQTG